jgi:predicted aldo/keto reductase-like oxidoreductase
MQYRTFGRLAWRPSALGFGAMRLPILDGDHGRIDEDLATRMIRKAIDRGVNYVDTAWPYHKGESEAFIGRCLQDGYRDRVRVATKLPSWLVETRGDFDRYLDEQLERLQTEQIDFYLLHGLNKVQWPKLRDLKILSAAERAIADGRIGHLGFSFHDDLAVFKEIVDAYDWTFCQIMYNYMDVAFQAGREGLQYAADRGMAVVVMEPLRGGSLTRPAPEAVARLWQEAKQQRSQADWALQWVWSHPEVSLVLSGMSAMCHVDENLDSADRSRVGGLSADELSLVDRVRETYRSLSPIPCTGCRYCMPCPQGVNIPWLFSLYNDATMYANIEEARRSYRFSLPENKADRCVACRRCEQACPQQIEIVEWLRTVHAALHEDQSL